MSLPQPSPLVSTGSPAVQAFVELVRAAPPVVEMVDAIYSFVRDDALHVWTILGRLDWEAEDWLAELELQVLENSSERLDFYALPAERAATAELPRHASCVYRRS